MRNVMTRAMVLSATMSLHKPHHETIKTIPAQLLRGKTLHR